MHGSIASIETLTSVDGPGIRSIVFMSGCLKRCLYCHNPEMFKMPKPNYNHQELVNKLLRYKNYFQRGGGITFSGGEPLLQTNFLIPVLKKLKKENIHIAIDTAGDFRGNIQVLLKYVDLIILDIKHVKEKEYEYLTKTKMDNIEKFIKIINQTKIPVNLRQVIVPNFNDNLDYLQELKEYIKRIKNVKSIEFLPYHKLGSEKYQELQLPNPMENIPAMNKDKCDKLYQEFLNML